MRTRVSCILAALLAMVADAKAQSITNQFTLQTSGQSLYGRNSDTWTYDSGFQGAAYGTYTVPPSSPASGGINAITGSDVYVPPVVIPGGCFIGICTPDITITPGYDLDTRTGAALGAQSSGQIGVDVSASATGGAVSVTLPVTATINFNSIPDGTYNVVGTAAISGGSIQISQPSFTANVDAIMNFDNTLSGTGCFLGAGCSSSSSSVNLDPGRFNLISVNTQDAHPISAFGLGLPIAKLDKTYTITTDTDGNVCVSPCAKQVLQAPSLLRVTPYTLNNIVQGGIDAFSGQTLSASGQQTVVSADADLTGIAQKILGASTDVLNPSISFGAGIFTAGTISGKLFDAQAGVNLGLSQSVSFTPSLYSTLNFDEPVDLWQPELDFCVTNHFGPNQCFTEAAQWVNAGDSITIPLNGSGTLMRYDNTPGDLISQTYGIQDAVNNDFAFRTGLTIDPNLLVQAGCFDFELAFDLGGTGLQCAFNTDFATTSLVDIGVDFSNFNLGGFNTVTEYDLIPVEGQPDIGSPTVAAVPEPGTLLVFGAGLVGVLRRRKWGKTP